MKRLICGYLFSLITTLELERDSSGILREFNPLDRNGRPLSDAPFCRFAFPSDLHLAGVYAITQDDRVVYVGRTNDLSRRYGPGEYGHIVVPDPANSQVTNRRVNHGILEAGKRGMSVQVWFHETTRRDNTEAEIIKKLDLPWNRQSAGASDEVDGPTTKVGRSDWRLVMRQAEMAKATLRKDRSQGERLFADLIRANPNDGMVYLKRAEAYEQVGAMSTAHEDFLRAEQLLPFPGRKAEARAGAQRTGRGA